jgi:hypothetical protein
LQHNAVLLIAQAAKTSSKNAQWNCPQYHTEPVGSQNEAIELLRSAILTRLARYMQ